MRRHWKQHWDPSADLVAKRRLRMGDDPNKPFVLPGEIITQAQREKLGLNRLRRWFENGTLQLADFVAPEPQRRLALQTRPCAPVALLDPEPPSAPVTEAAGLDKVEELVDEVIEPKSYIRDESGKVELFKPEQKGTIVLDPADQKRLERNAKAKAKRAANKADKVKRDKRNAKARERRAAAKAARVNAGE